MTILSDLALPREYAVWQERLAREFFTDRRQQPVVMFVDRDQLNELADQGEDGPRSLASAVRELVDIAAGNEMFMSVAAAQRRWERGDHLAPPPTLPVLAITVLAASEMRARTNIAKTNYYLPLAEALTPEEPASVRESVHTSLSGLAFAPVVDMWKRISAWLAERNGELGISTIPDNPGHWTRIGYPLSQTLLRRSDRAALSRLFGRLNLKQAGVPGPESLLTRLQLWVTGRSQGFSQTFLRAVADPDLRDLIKPLVHDLATSWDGKVVTPEGLRRLDIRLTVQPTRRLSWWSIPAVADAPNDVLKGAADGHEFTAAITHTVGDKYYKLTGLPAITPGLLTTGFSAKGATSLAEFRPSDLLVFIADPNAGGWISVDVLRPYEEYIFAARKGLEDDVKAALDLAADRDFRKINESASHQFLRGYVLFDRVSFSDRTRHNDALSLLQLKSAGTLQFGDALQARLVGGLPLLGEVSKNTYLAGGEPDLELPSSETARPVLVAVDGQYQPFQVSMFSIPLNVVSHDIGAHKVETDEGDSLEFHVVEGVGADATPTGVGSLGWADGELGPTSSGSICGAATGSAPTPDVILAWRTAKMTWLISHAGRAQAITPPKAPAFLGDNASTCFEVHRGAGAWLVQKFQTRWDVVPLKASEPEFGQLTPDDLAFWRAAPRSVQDQPELWQRYVDAWERARGH